MTTAQLLRCPYCLQTVEKFIRDEKTNVPHCPNCRTDIPKTFLDTQLLLRTMVGVVGFSGHGKTVYLTSLFSTLKRFSNFWNGYYFRSLDDFTHRIIYEQVPLFEKGALPESTPANFPNPALVHYHQLPVFDDAFVGYYDTAGEVFNDVTQIARAGFFVAHANTVLFIMSIPDCDEGQLDDQMSRLLDTYIRAADDRLNTNLRTQQRLVIIFTKADMMHVQLSAPLKEWLNKGNAEYYAMNLSDKLLDLGLTSIRIEEWLRQDLGCTRFPNMARDHFREVRYTIVSAMGVGDKQEENEQMNPLRVLDPFLWVLDFARRDIQNIAKKGFFERILDWLKGQNALKVPAAKPLRK
jgi:ABC-type dipeptide/oligopeptide/nickel transport system ATPase component